jgi:hypothetical protein
LCVLLSPKREWGDIRKDAKCADRLANQLALTLSRIRSGLGGRQVQATVPHDIERLNQVVGNAVSGLAADWNNNLD